MSTSSGIRGTTTLTGVFGYPVAHSASPQMHNAAFAALGMDWAYVPFAVAPADIESAVRGIRALGLRGVNVTVPLKELIPPLMDDLTPRARALGAVNTIKVDNGRLIGDSTDGPGFIESLRFGGITVQRGFRAVILGAGGSGRAVALALAEAGATVLIVNRNRERAEILAWDLADFGDLAACGMEPDRLALSVSDADLLVNTTSAGMHPDVATMPEVPTDSFLPSLFVYDLIYNPAETMLLRVARERGCRVQNGVEMLVRQGALSFAQWTGVEAPPIDVMRSAVQAALATVRKDHGI